MIGIEAGAFIFCIRHDIANYFSETNLRRVEASKMADAPGGNQAYSSCTDHEFRNRYIHRRTGLYFYKSNEYNTLIIYG